MTGSIRVIVEDRGPGIPLAERQHLFERFYRGSRSGQRASSEGTGLGLSLVAEHVRLHGGSVLIDSAPGGGSRFIVELPLVDDESDWGQA
jgi:two-component system sensor histidine kinase MtrB